VDKLTYPFVAKLHGTSYERKHCLTKTRERKHTPDLSPYPVELIPFQPLDSANNQFSQLYRKFKEHPYKEAGNKGFMPLTPFAVQSQFLQSHANLLFRWPTLVELNGELKPEFRNMNLDNWMRKTNPRRLLQDSILTLSHPL
jgi:hypothetical protein